VGEQRPDDFECCEPETWRRRTFSRRVLVAMALTGGLLLITAADASAQTPRTYVTDFEGYDYQVDELVTDQISRTTRDRLEVDPTLQVARRIEAGESTGEASPAIIAARRAYETGRGQFVDQRFSAAAESFEKSLDYLDTNVSDIEDWEMVKGALFRLAVAHHQSGKADAADAAMRRVLAMTPDLDISTDETLTEAFVTDFEALRKKLAKRKPGALDTSSVAPGAEIWIDGQVRGATPMTVKSVAPGTHYVSIKKGDDIWGSTVAVEPGETTKIDAKLEAAGGGESPAQALRDAIRDGTIGDDARLAAQGLANRAATDLVVTALVVPLEGGGGFAVQPFIYTEEVSTLRALEPVMFDDELLELNVQAYKLAGRIISAAHDPRQGDVIDEDRRFTPASYDSGDDSSATAADVGDGGEGTGTGTGGGAIITDVPDEESWYENPWVWTGVGLGLAAIGGTVAAVLLTTGDDGAGPTGFNATIEW